jgi:pimeloyl-ACP methyl ester carboxylesterase
VDTHPWVVLVRIDIVAEPDLTRLDVPSPSALVLLLHGGKDRSDEPVDGRSASWRRMAAVQRAVTPAAHKAGASTWLLRYRVRGWNGGAPVVDARWALQKVRRDLGDIPVVLLGHSMGGRTAVHVADDPSVVGVVALAPWLATSESVTGLAGKTLRAAHGSADRITSARATKAYVERASAAGADATFTDMGRVGHYMFRRISAWNEFASEQSLAVIAATDRA